MTWLSGSSCSMLHCFSEGHDTSKGESPSYPGRGRREDPPEALLWGKRRLRTHAPTRVACMALTGALSVVRSH
ncbi:hypothetical protein IQ07DRAFT_119694 [Pyrenochaeta sp. DS3sAY3a]|nr:hypothetical protein IQ07DRAFT_119694 [Pyrenochaeta sp. DS3sAY3a]